MTERRFPIQADRCNGAYRAHPPIPWSIAEEAYAQYVARYGNGQSLERLAERGGFSPSEMDTLLPAWEARCDRIKVLEAELAARKRMDEEPQEQDVCRDGRVFKRIPASVWVCIETGEVQVFGDATDVEPPEWLENEDYDRTEDVRAHNCDVAGCSSTSHRIAKGYILRDE